MDLPVCFDLFAMYYTRVYISQCVSGAKHAAVLVNVGPVYQVLVIDVHPISIARFDLGVATRAITERAADVLLLSRRLLRLEIITTD